MDSHRKRSTLHRLSVVWPMNDKPRGPGSARDGAIVCRQHAAHDVLIDVGPERSRDDARNPWTAEPRITRVGGELLIGPTIRGDITSCDLGRGR